MKTTTSPSEATLHDYLDALGSGRPTPGGGSGAALGGAAGAALVAMLAKLSVGREECAAHVKMLRAVAEEADDARGRLLALADEDAAAYAAVAAAYRMPAGSDGEKEARAAAVADALKGATEVPLKIMEVSAEVIGLAKNAVERGMRNAAADGAVGAELCRAGLRGAAAVVQANLHALEDDAYKGLARTRMDEMLYMGTKVCQAVDSYVNDLWR